MTTKKQTDPKKQVAFYADPEVFAYLQSLDSGVKTYTINSILREYIRSRGLTPYRTELFGSLTQGEVKKHVDHILQWCEIRTNPIRNYFGAPIARFKKLPLMLVHLVPFSSDDPINAYTIDELFLQNELLRPVERLGFQKGYNADGFLTYNVYPDDGELRGYVQFYRTGQIESVRELPLFDKHLVDGVNEKRVIHGGILENDLLLAVNDYLTAIKNVRIAPPVLLKASLINVKGCRLATHIDLNGFDSSTPSIDREEVSLPPVLFSEYPSENELPIKMMSLIDSIWNAAGYRKSPYHNTQDGKKLMPVRGSY